MIKRLTLFFIGSFFMNLDLLQGVNRTSQACFVTFVKERICPDGEKQDYFCVDLVIPKFPEKIERLDFGYECVRIGDLTQFKRTDLESDRRLIFIKVCNDGENISGYWNFDCKENSRVKVILDCEGKLHFDLEDGVFQF